MKDYDSNDPLLDIYIFETSQLVEQLETCILHSEKSGCCTVGSINEIFRIMHTIKVSSAMMMFENISILAHSMEDLFFFIREQKLHDIDYSTLTDLVFECVDFIKVEIEKIKNNDSCNGNASDHIKNIEDFLLSLKKDCKASEFSSDKENFSKDKQCNISDSNFSFKSTVFFEDNCGMENLRAYTVIENLREFAEEIYFIPGDIMENDSSIEIIRERGFTVYLKTDRSYDELHHLFSQIILLKHLELVQLKDDGEAEGLTVPGEIVKYENQTIKPEEQKQEIKQQAESQFLVQNIINVNVSKLDKLMDLVGEMVIAEAMITQNPELKGLEIGNFQKAARQLHKITAELQDMVMSIRMVPLATAFQKMHRVVRDMSKKLDKEVRLKLIGEETEVDKNIIEHISDPLMHLVRNAIDHGIESAADRTAKGKPETGLVTLEAKNAGSDVLIIVKDDGKGLNKEKILNRAKENSLLTKNEEEMTDRDIYNLIFMPGFSTKDSITEFSGRGVGMDVVIKNIEAVGGSIMLDSIEGAGSTVTLKIPLTLAIVDGMNVRVGNSRYTLPIVSIKESFKPKENDLIKDPDGSEMIMVRGKCYPILRLYEYFGVRTDVHNFHQGILVMLEQDDKTLCVFADELLGQQQVVVKALPNYIRNGKKIEGIAGCTLLGDGSISLILDVGRLIGISG